MACTRSSASRSSSASVRPSRSRPLSCGQSLGGLRGVPDYASHGLRNDVASSRIRSGSDSTPSPPLLAARRGYFLTGVDEQASAISYFNLNFLTRTCTFPNMLYAWGEERARTLYGAEQSYRKRHHLCSSVSGDGLTG